MGNCEGSTGHGSSYGFTNTGLETFIALEENHEAHKLAKYMALMMTPQSVDIPELACIPHIYVVTHTHTHTGGRVCD
jgi:hypothetical protein